MSTTIDGSGSLAFSGTVSGSSVVSTGGGTFATDIQSASQNGGPLAGNRNRIINGDMRVDQRNAGAAITVGSGLFYAVDRFYSSNQTGGGTITAQQSTLNGAKSLLVTATAAVTDLSAAKFVYGASQPIEAQNMFDLNGKPVVLSFKVQTNWAGKLAVALRNGAGNRCYIVDVNVTAGVNVISVPITLEAATASANDNSTGLQVSIGFNNTGTYQTTTTGAWAASGALCSNLSTQWALTTGNYINVTEVQLEAGTVATPFERRPIGAELALCQRYARLSQLYAMGRWNSQTSVRIFFDFSCEMRLAPSISLLTTTINFEETAISAHNCTGASITATGADTKRAFVDFTGTFGGTVTGGTFAQINTSGAILFSTEL